MTVRDMVRWLVLSVWSGPGGVNDDTKLLESGMDEAGVKTLVNLVQQQFVVDVEEEEVGPDSFGSITRLSSFVEKKLAEPQTSRFGAMAHWLEPEEPQAQAVTALDLELWDQGPADSAA